MGKTLYDKLWESHLVEARDDGTALIYIDRQLLHEVTSPQAFEGLRLQKRKVRRPELTLAVPDHNVPTTDRSKGIDDKESKIQVDTLRENCREFGVELFDVNDFEINFNQLNENDFEYFLETSFSDDQSLNNE